MHTSTCTHIDTLIFTQLDLIIMKQHDRKTTGFQTKKARKTIRQIHVKIYDI